MEGKRAGWWLGLVLIGVDLTLSACGESFTPTPALQPAPLQIPTFTPLPVKPGTPTPSPIIVPATSTPLPTLASTATPTPVPPPTLASIPSPVPTKLPTPTSGGNGFREITVEQARNLNGYRALLPAYLPSGFRLAHLSASQTVGPRLITLLAEYDDSTGRAFYYNVQASPDTPPTARPIATTAPVTGPLPTVAPTFTPRPTAPGLEYQQETVTVRSQPASLSYSRVEVSLRWSEGLTAYSINGQISREEVLKVAESLR